ncbi:posterior protein-like [Aquarana catesbeiana]|uniref:posterior protein-like n=1 Tax=Aquarana catesbeiana TaxID=8400 RepID=UPI003CCA0EEF
MELVYTYVKKYASANYHSCADEPLKSQCKVLLSQCQQYNSRLLGKQLKKKVKKERLANEIAVLLRIKFISEQIEGKWEPERRRRGEDIEEISENLLKTATASSSEMDELRATADNLSERNSELQEQLQRCSMDCDMKSKLLESLRIKVSEMEELVMSLERKLAKAHSQLLTKKQCIVSLNEHEGTCQLANISTVNEEKGCDETQSAIAPIASKQNNSLITIQERLTLCQILGEFNALESPVSLSNKFEALFLRFNLGNEDACSLLKAWLPGPLAGQLSAQVNDDLPDAEVRRKELQRIVDSRDNGMSDLQQMKFRRGDDPILFCSEYLALYTKVFKCPDLLEDDTSFIYSMANKCYVSYPTRMAPRNARSYQNVVNILQDFCQESSDREYGSKAGVSVISRGTGRQREFRHSKWNRHWHRFCKALNIASMEQETPEIQVSATPTQDRDITAQRPDMKDSSQDRSHSSEEEIRNDSPHPINCQQQDWMNIPIFAPWANLPFWLVCS